ncbi:hypothetical protein TorRG33x02_095020 [Trema orientale]|uniref:Uncharacterized protein n=1 Tax=Trema orientale TaxID=63057 RepID=A0A2P5FAA9_TREOI|nr:hypothetical protein TorRG33x02_095020 [Trema orientale]
MVKSCEPIFLLAAVLIFFVFFQQYSESTLNTLQANHKESVLIDAESTTISIPLFFGAFCRRDRICIKRCKQLYAYMYKNAFCEKQTKTPRFIGKCICSYYRESPKKSTKVHKT